MKQALEQKDLDLAAARKTAREKNELADEKLASVGKLEEENAKLKTAIGEANKEVVQLKKDNVALTDKVGDLTRKRDELEDEAAMNVLQLESRLASAMDYLARLKVVVSRIDTALWPRVTFQNDLESLMTRLNEIPGRVQEWKKSSARCGADVALSQVCVHCKEAKEEKLAALRVANTKKLDFQSFMETFIEAATRIVDGIDLDEFIEPASPPPAE
nr:uncharacterized protein LOC109747392 [Aegilops tauschii subsp. strangulata]